MSRERRVLKGKERARDEKRKGGSERIHKEINTHPLLPTVPASLPQRGREEAFCSHLQVRFK